MEFLDDGTDNVEYECINSNILDGNFRNTPLIITEVNYVAIDADYSACHGYYIMIFSSYPYDRVQMNMSTFSTRALILGHHGTGTLIYRTIF